jgi:hypothetical protein
LLDSSTPTCCSRSADKSYFLERSPIPRLRLQQALSVPGVAAGYPLWIDERYFVNPQDASQRPIRVIGFRAGDPVFKSSELREAARLLLAPRHRAARPSLPPLLSGHSSPGRRRSAGASSTWWEASSSQPTRRVGQPAGRRRHVFPAGAHPADPDRDGALKTAPGADPRGDRAVDQRAAAGRRARAQQAGREEPRHRVLGYGTPISIVVGIGC